MKKTGIITFLISLILFGGVFATSNFALPKVQKVEVEEIKGDDLAEGNVIEQKIDNELLFLIAGVDEEGEQLWSRTDTLMLVHANFDTGDIHLISIPRDTRVFIDDVHGYDKINHANAFGGMQLTLRTIRNFLGIDLDYFMQFSFESVEHIVDAMGGVEANVPVRIRTWNPDVDLHPGLQRLNGKEALMFARFRKGYENGDIGRLQAQQHLVTQMVKEMLKPHNITKLPAMLDLFYDEVQTNIGINKLKDLLPLAKNFSADKIKTTHIPGQEDVIDGIYYASYDQIATQEIVDTYLYEYKIAPVHTVTEELDIDESEDYDDEDYSEEEYYEEDAYEEEYSDEDYYEEDYYEEDYSEEEYYEEDDFEEEYYEEEYYEEEPVQDESYEEPTETNWEE